MPVMRALRVDLETVMALVLAPKEHCAPFKPEVNDRKKFETLNQLVRARNGWITSIPGAPDVTMECLLGSSLPDDLRGLCYDVVEAGETKRKIAQERVQLLTTVSS